jgi:low temperature requirement protein LtrA
VAADAQRNGETVRVTTLELFFDLVFVFTVTQLTSVLYEEPNGRGLFQVVLMLGVIWWMYGGYAWLTNAVTAHTTVRRLLLLGGMGGYFVISLAVPDAFSGRWTLAVAFEWLTPQLRRPSSFAISPSHFVERHGLVVIVAIGELVVALGIGASHLAVDGSLVVVALVGLALSACLWWLYFVGVEDDAEAALTALPRRERSRAALNAFGY